MIFLIKSTSTFSHKKNQDFFVFIFDKNSFSFSSPSLIIILNVREDYKPSFHAKLDSQLIKKANLIKTYKCVDS